MEINPVSNVSFQGLSSQDRAPRGGEQTAETSITSASEVQVSINAKVGDLQLQLMVVERTLTRVETGAVPGSAAQDLFEVAGKSEFQARIASATDTSPEATAGRILDGITGFIFKAFELSHPDMTEEDFAIFQEQVLKGFEQGLAEAKEIIMGLGALNDELAAGINQTEQLVRDGLNSFFEDMLSQLRGEGQEPAESAAAE